MGRLIRRTKKTAVYSVSLPRKLEKDIESIKNFSEYVTKLIVADLEKRKIKEKLEEAKTKVDLTGHSLTEQEIRYIADMWLEDADLNYSNRTRPRESLSDQDPASRCYGWYDILVLCWFERELWQKMIDHVAEKFPEISKLRAPVGAPKPDREMFFGMNEEAINELDKVLQVLDKTIDVMWQERWRKRYHKVVVADYTLEQICRMIDERAERGSLGILKLTIKGLARILQLNYQQVYKIAPLIEEEFGSIDYRTKQD